MPIRWKVFRIVCVLQMIAAAIFAVMALIGLLLGQGWGELIRLVLFVLIFLLTMMAINIVNNNYPDTPIVGSQKNNFNRLFLLNFLFLGFLFGIIFADYRELKDFVHFFNRPMFSLPYTFFIAIGIDILILIFQFYILYGLYELRRELYFNFSKKQFEFEKDQAV